MKLFSLDNLKQFVKFNFDIRRVFRSFSVFNTEQFEY